MKIMTVTLELDGDSEETMSVQADILAALLHFSALVPGLVVNANHICACGQCRIEEHIYRFEAGKQITIQ